ncbi:RNA polymerase sigma factor [Paenibacillus soyae]|uniref:RNA polymerase sigma factor n=1 Tax=Paenibacillus soyae TaxID=2969249 RepID=A0A9X2MQZ2_9BACL|nr:sigma-70 family RNA polymerase sigma factor [Paenibacillus soyae]MCR2804569.1 sigma-70 family RNA polymerase sigma factor [Paenibacillus soyae]
MEIVAETAAPLLRGNEGAADREREWVERARAGDHEAFGELVRMHRAKALGLAGAMTKDAYLAEDIVQEALIRAFLHLGTLTDNGRFAAWLQRIVRNQAYMKLRRGGPYGNERPFESFKPAAQEQGGGAADPQSVDWFDIDSILFHLAGQAQEASRNSVNPEQCLIRKETLQGIHMLIRCLSKKERDIFEARFFGELPPQEIASLFGTTTAGVYNSLSRSRAKLQKERLRISIGLYVERRAALGLPRKKILAPPP